MSKPQIVSTIQETAKTVAQSTPAKLTAMVVVTAATIAATAYVCKKIEEQD
jgi:hypothetical protein